MAQASAQQVAEHAQQHAVQSQRWVADTVANMQQAAHAAEACHASDSAQLADQVKLLQARLLEAESNRQRDVSQVLDAARAAQEQADARVEQVRADAQAEVARVQQLVEQQSIAPLFAYGKAQYFEIATHRQGLVPGPAPHVEMPMAILTQPSKTEVVPSAAVAAAGASADKPPRRSREDRQSKKSADTSLVVVLVTSQ